ncbi:MAG TPA: peptidase M13 [Bacteroidetes bacterium]|jgi:putative endopeptidase|nr:peptidase M13 [Bacteroidota bacterium]
MKTKTILLTSAATLLIGGAFVYKSKDKGVDIQSIDKKANPRNDFNQFANGKWIQNNPVPSTESRWTSFNVIAERNYDLLRTILETAAADKSASKGSARQKIGDFYRIAMDTNKLEADNYAPLTTDLGSIMVLVDAKDVMNYVGKMHRKGLPAFFGFGVNQDVKKSDEYACYLSQAGLGLPDRDYYLKDDEKSKNIRKEYLNHISRMFQMIGNNTPESEKIANDILEFETALAKASMTRVERRDPDKTYNKKTTQELETSYPNINWKGYFEQTGLAKKNVSTFIVGQPLFFEELNKRMGTTSIFTLRNYLKWKAVSSSSSYMSSRFADESFRFYSTILTGTKEQKPRWKRTVNQANNLIGELVAQEYVKVAFSEESKKRLNKMVDNLREAFKIRIQNLDWMSAETKTKALEKLASFNRKIGYPDKWTDFTKLEIKNDSYLENYFRSNTFEFDDNINRLGKPIDKAEWGMLPQTVNAYYSPLMNEIVFPAAIMQPPFFDPAADDAVNYGAIGAVIGHEFSHGFDDKGCKFDAKGNLNNWWTEADKSKFDARTKVMVNQYNKYKVEDSVYVNGELTLGENIADFAGLTVSYDAYMLSLKGKEKKKINGFTPEQRFFIGFAQVWRGNARPEFLRQQVVTDPHSPARFRVLGPLSNMPQFYEAFGVQKGDGMYRDDSVRVKIW